MANFSANLRTIIWVLFTIWSIDSSHGNIGLLVSVWCCTWSQASSGFHCKEICKYSQSRKSPHTPYHKSNNVSFSGFWRYSIISFLSQISLNFAWKFSYLVLIALTSSAVNQSFNVGKAVSQTLSIGERINILSKSDFKSCNWSLAFSDCFIHSSIKWANSPRESCLRLKLQSVLPWRMNMNLVRFFDHERVSWYISSSVERENVSKGSSTFAQIGNGLPQYLFLATFRSGACFNQFTNLFETLSGMNLIFSASPIVAAFICCSLINHDDIAFEMRGVWHLQQWGYECVIDSDLINFFSAFRRSIISLFTVSTLCHW